MTRLTMGMYGGEFNRTSHLFGISCGQICTFKKRTHNGGWYNKAGEKLGWGDLSTDDMVRVSLELEAGELFIVLSEGKSHGDFPRNGLSESAPGVAYVAKHALFIITPGSIYEVSDYKTPEETSQMHDGQVFLLLDRRNATRLIATGRLP